MTDNNASVINEPEDYNPTDYCATETPHVDREVPERDNPQLSTRCPHCNADLTAPEDMDVELVYAILHFDLEDPKGERRLQACLRALQVLRETEWANSK